MTFGHHHSHITSWWEANVPPTQVTTSAFTYIGGIFVPQTDGNVWGIRCYLDGIFPAPYTSLFWEFNSQQCIAVNQFSQKSWPGSINGWNQLWFPKRIPVSGGTQYRAAVLLTPGHYYRWNSHLGSGLIQNGIQYLNGFQSTSIYPPTSTITTNTNANGVDLLFAPPGSN